MNRRAALDEENEQRVLDLLTDLHRQGHDCDGVTHNPALGRFADRILRLQHGKYLGEGQSTCAGIMCCYSRRRSDKRV